MYKMHVKNDLCLCSLSGQVDLVGLVSFRLPEGTYFTVSNKINEIP